MRRGKFITLEGGEGVGKTTNLAFIREKLEQAGLDVVVTREPGGTELAEQIRNLLLLKHQEKVTAEAELLLMFAARSQHIRHVIEPALKSGQWVLCDRFTDATFAYQGGGRGMDEVAIAWLEQWVQQTLRPDLTILLDAPVETGIERVRDRGALDRFESEQHSFFERVRKCYLQRADRHSERFVVIDAARCLSLVQKDIETVVGRLLP